MSLSRRRGKKIKEYDIAVKKVIPYIKRKLRWSKELVSEYGRVPVQIGGKTVWADIVCYISIKQKRVPWLLIEVKKQNVSLEQATAQAESYSLILGAPFFCVTDGVEYNFYSTANSQGQSIKLDTTPPIPEKEYLISPVEKIVFPAHINDAVSLFFNGLEKEEKFYEDTKGHHDAQKQINKTIFQRIDSFTHSELKELIDSDYFMIKNTNKKFVFEEIDRDISKFRKVFSFILDFKGDPIINIEKLLENDMLHIKGCGIFFISQFLTGAYPDDYVIVEENVSKALKYLDITDIFVQYHTANGYIYINEICKKLYKDKLESRLKPYGFGLAAVHNFLWHYYSHYRNKEVWFP